MMIDTIPLPSPNQDSRHGQAVDMLVLHYTGMKDGARAMARLTDAAAEVSAHYVVDEQGQVFALVDESQRAWHAGKASWCGHININQRSIGIEIVNPGHEFGYRSFPNVQMAAVIALCQDILARHAIAPQYVIGHSDVAPSRKQDPGELFDWAWLAREGIGLCPASKAAGRQVSAEALELYGYDISHLPAAITAFQRHFRQAGISGVWDDECASILTSLLDAVDSAHD